MRTVDYRLLARFNLLFVAFLLIIVGVGLSSLWLGAPPDYRVSPSLITKVGSIPFVLIYLFLACRRNLRARDRSYFLMVASAFGILSVRKLVATDLWISVLWSIVALTVLIAGYVFVRSQAKTRSGSSTG